MFKILGDDIEIIDGEIMNDVCFDKNVFKEGNNIVFYYFICDEENVLFDEVVCGKIIECYDEELIVKSTDDNYKEWVIPIDDIGLFFDILEVN